MPQASSYSSLPPHQPQSTPVSYSLQPVAKRPKIQSPYPQQPASLSPVSPLTPYHPPTPSTSVSYATMSAPTSMLPPPPPSQQPGGGGGQPPKATDTNELADALASAGIDLKEEEAHLSMPVNSNISGINAAESLSIRRDAELKANHALNPFVNTRVLQNKIRAKAREHNMTLGMSQGLGTVSQDITTYLSLAMRERLHGLVTRSIVLARQRRVGNGMISGEWGAFVKGGDKHHNSDGVTSGSPVAQNPLKRSFSTFSNANTSHTRTQTTTSISNETARALRLLAQQDLQAETQRLQLKGQKATSTPTNGTNADGIIASPSQGSVDGFNTGSGGPLTPAADSGGPEFPSRKLSAKETRKHQDTRVQEAVAHRAANSTAAMMMGLGGAFGGKKKKYAWMMSGTPGALGVSAPHTQGGSGAGPSRMSLSGGGGAAGSGGVTEALSVWGKRIGEWREDGEKGLGIQIRDWVGALEGDGRERKAVVRAYMRMK